MKIISNNLNDNIQFGKLFKVEWDLGYYYCPYISMEILELSSYSLPWFDEKKDWYDYFKRNERKPIIYRSKSGLEYNAKILNVNKNETVNLCFVTKSGKRMNKYNVSYKGQFGTSKVWWFK